MLTLTFHSAYHTVCLESIQLVICHGMDNILAVVVFKEVFE